MLAMQLTRVKFYLTGDWIEILCVRYFMIRIPLLHLVVDVVGWSTWHFLWARELDINVSIVKIRL